MDLNSAIRRAREHSPFLARLLEQEAPLLDGAWLDDPIAHARVADAEMPIARRLRIERRRVALLVALGDLSGAYDLRRVTGLLTAFADQALDTAIRAAIEERTPGAPCQGFVAIALGKQGSRELNYSSDIDPILLFDRATLPHRERETADEAAIKIARRATELLQTRDGDGYVLRVDLRLRPAPEASPIALPVGAAISYYESQALPWERAAFIRARAAAGDIALGRRFLVAIRPFVWRRALDYGAVAEIRQISGRIRDHYAQGQAFGPGYDLKRGRGGIREAEFFAQVHQLIHGGRDRALRAPATLEALAALANAGWIAPEQAATLAEGYTLFRTIEHRLQMVDDRQTHSLPAGAEALDNVARLHGAKGGAALLALLAPQASAVAAVYDTLGATDRPAVPADAQLLEVRLAELGFAPADQAMRRIADWRSGRYPALRSPAARTALEAALPGMLTSLATASDPYQALIRLDGMLGRLPSAINLFRLLEAQPALATLLSAILCHAPTLAEALARRATLLDGLLDASALEPVGEVAELAGEMAPREAGAAYEVVLDHVRAVVGEKRFALGAQIIAGTSDPLAVAAGYARVAEAAIETLVAATVAEFAAQHGRVPDSELVIVALGRLGGGRLTHASDLDLVYLFTGDYRAESDGPKPLGAVLYYNRLAQRVSAALSVPTASGPLYEIDTRLRPSGAQGPLVVSLEGFARYQRESAWTWEHMALTRARPVFGSEAARAQVAGIIRAVLDGDRPERDIVAEAREMRAEMARHKPAQGPLDVKLAPGGLVDLEFAVHVVQLVHRTGFHADLPGATAALEAAGLLPGGLVEAHALLTRALVTFRLVAPDAQLPPPASRALVARALGQSDWDSAVASLEAARQRVSAAWAAVSKGKDAG
jgi:glutamate-ammonia-ligase adenylyltransferase